MAPPLPRGSIGALQLLAGLGVVAFALHSVLPDGERLSHVFDYQVYYALIVAAMVLAVARAFVPPHRPGWTAVAIAVCSYGVAEFVWLIAYADAESPPYPSIADFFYLLFFPASYTGVVLLFRARTRGVGAGLWIDGLTAALAAGALGSAVLVDAVLDTTEGSFATVATNVAYPIGDVLLLSIVLGAFAVTRWQPGRAWLLIGAALLVFALGDSLYLFQTASGTYVEGTMLDVTWPAALLLIACAGWQDRGRDRRIEAAGRAFLAVPAVCTAIAVGVLVLDHFHRVNLTAIVLATLALAAVVARLGLTFRDNRRLLELTRRESITDPVTGLGNRRRLVADLERAASEATIERPALLVIFDLDGFKGYNDAFGHPAGDRLLARLGAKLAVSGADDVVAYRLGGDEFCLLAPAFGLDIERLVHESASALSERGEGFHVTSSFGAVVLPEEAADASTALRLADERLYAQKHGKRSQRDRPHELLLQVLLEREPRLHSHTEGVAELALAVGQELGIEGQALEDLYRAAQLHDVGKLAVPDVILHKPGALDDTEWEFVRQHTLVGERILAVSPLLRVIGRIVRATHERWDGDGYPDRLRGTEIPLAARVISVCDAFSAMTSDRPYRAAVSEREALDELDRCAGTQFDPEVVRALRSSLAARVSVATR